MSEILTKIIPSNPAHKSPFAVISHESIHDHVENTLTFSTQIH